MLLQSANADVVFVASFLVRKVSQFHCMDRAIENQGRTQTGAQSKKEHCSSVVTSKRLHSGIVYDFHRALESGFKIEPNPTRSKVSRFCLWTATKNRPRIAQGYHIIFPIPRALLDPRNHGLGSHGGPGGEFYWFLLSGGQDLYVSPTDINHQHIHNRGFKQSSVVSREQSRPRYRRQPKPPEYPPLLSRARVPRRRRDWR